MGGRDGGKRGKPALGSAAVGRFGRAPLRLANVGQDLPQSALADRVQGSSSTEGCNDFTPAACDPRTEHTDPD